MEIRKLDEERDAGEVVALLRGASPTIVVSPASWLHRVRTIPERAEQAGWVAVDGGRVVANTRQAFRGRGLGIAVKLASIRWAKEHGITQMATRNDETNAPMLAINRRLGFQPEKRRVEWLREGRASSRARPAPAT